MLFVQTLKSLTRKEKWVSAILLLIFLLSARSLFLSSGEGDVLGSKAYSEGTVGQLLHINPVYTEYSEADADVSRLVFSGLMKYNAVTGEFEEDIATRTMSEDELSMTFTLKNDTYWHDGTPVTADDIYFTFAEVIQNPSFENTLLKSSFDGVSIVQENTRTVSFTLSSANSFFETSLTLGLLPKHILGEVPVTELDTHEFNKFPVGTGPYMVIAPYESNPDGGAQVSLSVFEQYYGTLPSIESMRFVAYPSTTELLENRSAWHGAARIPQHILDEIDLSGLVTYQYELPQYTALFFNTDAPRLSTNEMRLGVSKAIDKTSLLEAIGQKVAIDTPLLELNQEEWLHVYSEEEAAGALFDSGWSLEEGAEFRSNEAGESLSLRLIRRDFSESNPVQEESTAITAQVLKEQLAAVGVELIVEAYELEALQEVIVNRDYDILLYGQSLGYNLDTFSYWHSSQANEKGLNLSNYQNAKADFYIESIRESLDDEERQELLNALAEEIAKDIPAVFLYTPSYYYLVDTAVTGVQLEKLLLPKDRFANIEAWNFN